MELSMEMLNEILGEIEKEYAEAPGAIEPDTAEELNDLDLLFNTNIYTNTNYYND